MRLYRHRHAEERRQDFRAKQRFVSLVIGMRDERDTGRNQLRPRRLDLDVATCRPGEADAVIGAGLLAILELGLRDGGLEIDVP